MSAGAPSIPRTALIPARLLRTSRHCSNQCATIRPQIQSKTFQNDCRIYHDKWPFSKPLNDRSARPFSKSFHASAPSQATRDPYSVLGVGKDASAADIKRAYYGLAKKYHPDTNKDPNAKEKFAEAQSAYELLSDSEKRQAYDRFGSGAFDQNGGFSPGAGPGGPFSGATTGGFHGFGGGFPGGGFSADINFEDLFGAFTGGAGRRGRSRGGPFRSAVVEGDDIEVQTNISFMDAAKGTTKEIFITPLVQCKTCNGEGTKPGKKRAQCKTCGGTGSQVHFIQGGFQMASTCTSCGGAGMSIPRGSECNSCGGDGVVRERKTVHVNIPGGVEDGMRLRVPGEGDMPAVEPGARTQRGDLYVFIKVAPDSRFSRSGSDVLYTAQIPLTTALLGGEVTVPTLDGEVKVKVATGTGTGDKITLSGMGMRKLEGRRGQQGDLKVEFKVAMPKYLNANQRTILEVLADEMGDKTARRMMNINKNDKPPSPDSSTSNKDSSTSSDTSHKNEGFLKSAWHRLMNQHGSGGSSSGDTSAKPNDSGDGNKTDESKKASGSG
ncbi:molecular chaperone DnaJ [Blastomyces dermatitidis ER-3]|uniref:Molecular chaperone DnaJ n=1 Tax=Ajellomyces dermatitidis (strain ER-3 / ATCC MYA-2586) TaxID=559297 RepID=A0ABP2F3P4_AJEDR|nr:molecular chaperone DnaJ [Blastomyces dermatitidis ER-3]EEQ91235.1 molecular chaperone DnaJ [Blastomyces dermatitidis ER-3]